MASDKLMLSSEELAERKKDTNMLFLPVRATRSGRSPSAHSYLCQIPTSPSTAIAAHLFGDSEAAYQSRLSRSLAALKGLEKECITYDGGPMSSATCRMYGNFTVQRTTLQLVEPPYHAPTLVSASDPSFIPIIRKMKETESDDRSFDKPAASRLTDPPLVPKPDNAFPRNAPLEVADALYDDEYDPVQDLLDSVLQQQPLGGYDDYYDSEYDNDDAYIGRDLPLRQQQQQKEPNPSSHKRVPSEDGSRPSSTDDLDPLDERHWADEEYDFEDWANFHRYYRDNPDDEDEDAYDNKPKGSST
ncbi:hypothetical protein PhCBS80983_g00747 [Powellomyces hirtus]|uniref:Transcription factor Iwr1 domain-containing protein n=1 Tax=Powellomyces hirtus TaxID=109895 RepID=A0A507EDM8_9FUNG|nr:hypothetical protein PhCBS80983_g00747 [Powellomyces hirtus]